MDNEEKKSIYRFCVIALFFVVAESARIHRQSDDKCTLPEHPMNGKWSLSDSKSSSQPGTKVVSGIIISITCNGQYTLNGPSLIRCKNGRWDKVIGECLKLCPPITSTSSTKVTCTYNGKKVDDCTHALNGTVATFRCAGFYENSELNRNPFRICNDGSWDKEIPNCFPICGIKPIPSRKNKGYFPWNVAIYRDNGDEKDFRCTGTLINERIILTAAHCVTDEFGKILPTNIHNVVAGKSSNRYEDDKDREAQYSGLEDMFTPKEFKGQTRKYTNDIAVLVARTSFNMSRRIQPACMDWSNKYVEEFSYPKITGSIAGPLKSQYWPRLKEVVEIEIPFVNDTQCYTQLAPSDIGDLNFEAVYSDNKLCSGYINSDRSPKCRMDHGTGLVSRNPFDNKYYLTGILSVFPSIHSRNCDNKKWVLFTQVAKYTQNFIREKSDLYTSIKKSYFQTSCGTKSVQAKTLIVNGKIVPKGDYPWQVAIYTIQGKTKRLICGGSLINQRVVITAAHCVTDSEGTALSKQMFAVAVGKYYRNFDDPRDAVAQFSTLKEVFVSDKYQAERQNYLADIAILVTENSFTLSKDVEPVCVDWDAKYESQFLRPSVTGFVTGWGFTQENSKPSDELKDLEVQYIEKDECKEKLPTDYEIYLTSDKMCSGFLNKSKSVCSGDSGGGLVFKNINDGKYYLTGIVSLSPQAPTGGCDSQQYALYTKVSEYIKEFILKKVQLYWA